MAQHVCCFSPITEQATNPAQQELDWGLVVQISEAINKTELGAKEARKLLQKKIISNNVESQVLALQVSTVLKTRCAVEAACANLCHAQLLKALSEASPQKFHGNSSILFEIHTLFR